MPVDLSKTKKELVAELETARLKITGLESQAASLAPILNTLRHRRACCRDISVLLGEESIDYPGDTPYSRNLLLAIEEGGFCNLSRLEMSAHSGTHIDTPAHFIMTGGTVEIYSPSQFILPTVVVDAVGRKAITAEALRGVEIEEGDAVLFKTDNSTSGRCRLGSFGKEYVYITEEGAQTLAQKRPALVGLDYITIEKYGDMSFPAHHALLGNGILVLEGIDLKDAPPGRYVLICLPLKMKGAEASPVRAVLVSC